MKRWTIKVVELDKQSLSFFPPRGDEEDFETFEAAAYVGFQFAEMDGFVVTLKDNLLNKSYEVWASGIPQLNLIRQK